MSLPNPPCTCGNSPHLTFCPKRPSRRTKATVTTALASGVLELRLYVESDSRTVSSLTKAEAEAILDRLAALERGR